MKNLLIFLTIAFFAFFYSCKKNSTTNTPASPKVPVVTTSAVTNITDSSAITGGNITNDGGDFTISEGIVYGIDSLPTLDKSLKTIDGSGLKSFSSKLTGLSDNTKYYVRAYATTSAGTIYGDQVIFNTPVDPFKFHFYKDQSTEIVLYKRYLSSDPPETPWSISIANNLALPKGIILFIQVDSIQGDAISYYNNDTLKTFNNGDTMQIINDGSYYGVRTPQAYNQFGNYYYESHCQVTIKVGGKAITPDNIYYCKWYMLNNATMTNDTPLFYTDFSYQCNFEH